MVTLVDRAGLILLKAAGLVQCLVCLVVEPAVPLGRNHAGVVIHSVLGVVDDPPVTTIEILIVLVVFVPVLILSNKLATLL